MKDGAGEYSLISNFCTKAPAADLYIVYLSIFHLFHAFWCPLPLFNVCFCGEKWTRGSVIHRSLLISVVRVLVWVQETRSFAKRVSICSVLTTSKRYFVVWAVCIVDKIYRICFHCPSLKMPYLTIILDLRVKQITPAVMKVSSYEYSNDILKLVLVSFLVHKTNIDRWISYLQINISSMPYLLFVSNKNLLQARIWSPRNKREQEKWL